MVEFVSKSRLREMLADASESSIWRWVKAGRLPKPRQVGPNRVGWLVSELEPALEAFLVAECKPVAVPGEGKKRGRKPATSKQEV